LVGHSNSPNDLYAKIPNLIVIPNITAKMCLSKNIALIWGYG
jgi:hypothetical protein